MENLHVSVIIPTHNRASVLPRAVASALAATAPGDEVLVMDEASTDGTEQVLRPFADRVRYVRCPQRGTGAARNRGIELASNPLVAFLDSEDEWRPDKLYLQRALMRCRPDVLFCFSSYTLRQARKPPVRHYLSRGHKDPRGWSRILGPGAPFSTLAPLPPRRRDFRVHTGSLYLAELEADCVPTFTLLVRRDQAGSALRFAQDMSSCADWETIARLSRAGTAAYLDCDTAYRWGHEGPCLTDASELAEAMSRLTILDRVWGADEPFLAQHREHFERKRAAEQLRLARVLIRQGRVHDARTALLQAGGGPWRYRFLASMPGPLTRTLFTLRALCSL